MLRLKQQQRQLLVRSVQIKLLQQAIQAAKKQASEADKELEHEANQTLEELQTAQMILRGHGPGGDLRKLLKQKQPSLLAWLLGPRVNVISIRVLLQAMPPQLGKRKEPCSIAD